MKNVQTFLWPTFKWIFRIRDFLYVKLPKIFSTGGWLFNARRFKYKPKNMISVSKYGIGVYENFQSDMYDVAYRALERLFAIFSANAARFSLKLVGVNQ